MSPPVPSTMYDQLENEQIHHMIVHMPFFLQRLRVDIYNVYTPHQQHAIFENDLFSGSVGNNHSLSGKIQHREKTGPTFEQQQQKNSSNLLHHSNTTYILQETPTNTSCIYIIYVSFPFCTFPTRKTRRLFLSFFFWRKRSPSPSPKPKRYHCVLFVAYKRRATCTLDWHPRAPRNDRFSRSPPRCTPLREQQRYTCLRPSTPLRTEARAAGGGFT